MKLNRIILLVLLCCSSLISSAASLVEQAGESGVFNMGDALATLEQSDAGFTINFSLPPNTGAGVWTKGLSGHWTVDQADVVDLTLITEAWPQADVSLEIKGPGGGQRIPLTAAGTSTRAIDWPAIGVVQEVVLVVASSSAEPITGSITFDATPRSLGVFDQLSNSSLIRIVGLLLLSFLFAGSVHPGRTCQVRVAGFPKDLLVGLAIATLVGMVMLVLHLPDRWYAVAIGGFVVSLLLKTALTGSIPSRTEAFWSCFVSGVLAICASTVPVWQMPAAWSDFGVISLFGACLFLVLFHLANFFLLNTRKQHIGGIGSAIILLIPFDFACLLALQSSELMSDFGTPIMGRIVLLFMFNEFVINTVALVTRRRLVRGVEIHVLLGMIAGAMMFAPGIADFGAGEIVAASHPLFRSIISVICTMISQSILWAEAFLLTGVLLDGMRGVMPSTEVVIRNARSGLTKGAVYSGILMGVLQIIGLLSSLTPIQNIFLQSEVLLLAALGLLVFPLCKVIIESFDGSQSFFGRVARAYRDPVLYGRGLIIGLAMGLAISRDVQLASVGARCLFGAVAGIAAFAGISLLRDLILAAKGQGKVKVWRLYFVEGLLGAFIAAALAFYLDAAQIPIILQKFELYTAFGMDPNALVKACNEVRTTRPDEFRALLSNWGYIRLSAVQGGSKILFNEALMGVSVWGIAAWLFAINRALLQAIFDKTWLPVKRISSREGLADLVENTIHVTRWGLWMSPVIFTFLRPMGDPTWYNQDGAIRTLFATANSLLMDPGAFREWSLGVFTGILVYSGFRILIYLDHMGLRVATLVNLSFIGMDRLDERLARFIGRDATARFIPEGVKRFTTWAPLLIPFYLPAGAEWDQVWDGSQAIIAQRTGFAPDGTMGSMLLAYLGLALGLALLMTMCRKSRSRKAVASDDTLRIANHVYEVELKPSGELYSALIQEGYGISRPSFEGADPAGRVLFLVEEGVGAWPVLGNYPGEYFPKSTHRREGDQLIITNTHNDLSVTITISLPSVDSAVEQWALAIENKTDRERSLKIVPYLEWMLNSPGADRNHTQYNRLYPEMSYSVQQQTVWALHRSTKQYGFLASDIAPEGYHNGRIDFIGRAGTIWQPRILETLAFLPCQDDDPYPTFDPIGSLLIPVSLTARETGQASIFIGSSPSKEQASAWIARSCARESVDKKPRESVDKKPRESVENTPLSTPRKRSPLIGHGEILPGTPETYTSYEDDGTTLHIRTPFTPRPFDHSMSNALGHVLCVTNRGLHCSASVNAQQNRLTTDWADLVGREMPAEACYLYDPEASEWFSPTYEPLRDPEAQHDARFSLDGSATFTMRKGDVETELITHVPVNEPTGVYILTVRNTGTESRTFHVSPYFQIALAHSPELAGKLKIRKDDDRGVLFFENPSNPFRSGPAFVALSEKPQQMTTARGAFFGRDRSFAHPVMLESEPDTASPDQMACAALLTKIEIPAGGEKTISVLLGQADTLKDAKACIARMSSVEAAQASLQETRAWWLKLTSTLELETSNPEFDGYVHWMKYQALAERIWARKGFYQASGAFGFRDQLQDTVNMIWVDPALARKQLLLHAGQQFIDGDVVHWFFCTQDGRTGFANRSYASDNLLWLGWGVSEYVRMSGDQSLLDEQVSYLKAETPLAPLPQGKHGMGFVPLRSPMTDSVYEHVLKGIDHVFNDRMGPHGLPLILTGDWNDGLDEIGSEGKGESIWLAFFLIYILNQFLDVVEQRSGVERRADLERKRDALKSAVEQTWRNDRYLRAIHDDGTEIGIEGAGYWETDALTAAWAVYADVNRERGQIAIDTAIRVLERDNYISLGYPSLREDTRPFLGRSSKYPEGVRENGMYSHGVQWLVRGCRLLSEQRATAGDQAGADRYREAATRLWFKTAAISHVTPDQIEIYGGQPNKQCADYLTRYDPGRMIWNGYTGAAAWMLRQAMEGVLGFQLKDNELVRPDDLDVPRGDCSYVNLERDISKSPL